MRLKTFAPIVFFALWATALGSQAQQREVSAASSSANGNSLVVSQNPAQTTAQKISGDPTRAGDVKIEFYGHDAFKITSPAGLTVLVDPWRNDASGTYPKWFLNDFPSIKVDIVLSTHAHFDHDAVDRPNGRMVLARLVGQFKLGDIEITGLGDKHQCESAPCPPKNEIGFDNAIQIIETGGLRIAVWGDNRPLPDASLDHYLKNIDVLVLPVETVLSRAEADAIMRKYDPKVVIPAHYFIDGLTSNASGLESAEGWVNEQEKSNHADVHRLQVAVITLNARELKGAHGRIYYFGNHFEKK